MIIIEIDNNNDYLTLKHEDGVEIVYKITHPIKTMKMIEDILNAVNRATKGVRLQLIDEDTRSTVDEW